MKKSASHRKRSTIFFLLAVILGIACIVFGFKERWLGAILCTLVPFGTIITMFQMQLDQRKVMSVIGLSFVVHLVAVWAIFGRALVGFSTVSMLLCIPFVFIEAGMLYFVVKRVLATA